MENIRKEMCPGCGGSGQKGRMVPGVGWVGDTCPKCKGEKRIIVPKGKVKK